MACFLDEMAVLEAVHALERLIRLRAALSGGEEGSRSRWLYVANGGQEPGSEGTRPDPQPHTLPPPLPPPYPRPTVRSAQRRSL